MAAIGITLLIVLNVVLPWAALSARRLSKRAVDADLKYKRQRDYYFIVAALGIADFTIFCVYYSENGGYLGSAQ